MNVSLTPQLEALIQKKVKAGTYQTASEVVREGLRLLHERDEELAWVRKEVAKGFAAVERGEYTEYDSSERGKLTREITERGRKRLAQMRRKAKP